MAAVSLKREGGFTLVEIAVVVPIMMVIIIGLFTLLTYLLQSSASEQVGAQNLSEIHSGLGAIESDAALTNSFLPVLDDGITDPTQAGGWSYTGSGPSSRVLILRSFATTANPQSNDRQPVFINSQGCSAAELYYNDALTYDTVYFVKDSTLYRRRLLNTGKSTCTGLYQKQSCPDKTSGTPGCAADDEAIVTDVVNFSVSYYAASDSSDALLAYSDGTGQQQVADADSAIVTIGVSRKAYGQDLASTQSLRVSKLITGQSDNQ